VNYAASVHGMFAFGSIHSDNNLSQMFTQGELPGIPLILQAPYFSVL
jgi:hypothetical protein